MRFRALGLSVEKACSLNSKLQLPAKFSATSQYFFKLAASGVIFCPKLFIRRKNFLDQYYRKITNRNV